MFFYCGFTALLLGYFIGGTAGIIAGIALMVIVFLIFIFEDVKNTDIKSTLLIDLAMIASNIALFDLPELWPFTLTLGLGALSHIIHKIVNKRYDTSSVSAFLKSELSLYPELEFVIVAVTVYFIFEDGEAGDPYAWIFPVILALDFIRQTVGSRFFKSRNK